MKEVYYYNSGVAYVYLVLGIIVCALVPSLYCCTMKNSKNTIAKRFYGLGLATGAYFLLMYLRFSLIEYVYGTGFYTGYVPGLIIWTYFISFVLYTQPLFLSAAVLHGSSRISGKNLCCSANCCSMFTKVFGGITITCIFILTIAN